MGPTGNSQLDPEKRDGNETNRQPIGSAVCRCCSEQQFEPGRRIRPSAGRGHENSGNRRRPSAGRIQQHATRSSTQPGLVRSTKSAAQEKVAETVDGRRVAGQSHGDGDGERNRLTGGQHQCQCGGGALFFTSSALPSFGTSAVDGWTSSVDDGTSSSSTLPAALHPGPLRSSL